MNTIQDNTAKFQIEITRQDSGTEKNSLGRIGKDGYLPLPKDYDLPFFSDKCRPQLPPDAISTIIEQFTSLLQGVFGALEETIQGLFGLLNKEKTPVEQMPTPAATPAPAAQTPVEQSPAAPSEPTGEAEKPKEEKEPKALDKSGEFLWKPVSDKDGKLAIVLPGNLTGKVKSVKIVDADGKELGKKGEYSGTGNAINNGEREHYRFKKEGKDFPDGSFVEITLKNGNVKRVKIKETSERFTR